MLGMLRLPNLRPWFDGAAAWHFRHRRSLPHKPMMRPDVPQWSE